MRAKALLIVAVIMVVGLATIVTWRLNNSSDTPNLLAGEETSIPFVPPIGYEDVTPPATATPIAAPPDAVTISLERARDIGLRGLVGLQLNQETDSEAYARGGPGGSVDLSTISVTLELAGSHTQITHRTDDYPLWIVRANGTFRPFFCCTGAEFRSATVIVDAITAEILGVQLSDQLERTQQQSMIGQ